MGRKPRSARVIPSATHFFRRAMTECATFLRIFKMSMCPYSPSHVRVGRSGLASSGEKNDLDRVDQDQQIQEEREVLDVVEIVLELLEGVLHRGSVAVSHLRPARDPRLHREAPHV